MDAVSTVKFVFFEGTIVRSCGHACSAYCACGSQLLACDGRTLSGSEERLFPSRGTFFRPMHSRGCMPTCVRPRSPWWCRNVSPYPSGASHPPFFRPCSHVSFSLGRPTGVDPWDGAGSGGSWSPSTQPHTPGTSSRLCAAARRGCGSWKHPSKKRHGVSAPTFKRERVDAKGEHLRQGTAEGGGGEPWTTLEKSTRRPRRSSCGCC